MPSILLAVHCKKGDPVKLKDAILHYVSNTYGQRAAEDSGDDLDEVQQLRAQLINQPSAPAGLRDTLAKYYRTLCAMESRFPISHAPDHADVTFTWHDAFRPSKTSEQANIHFEKAAIAFNIGAATSQYALNCDRKTPQGLVDSAKLFQEAAGVFAHLRDAVALKVDAPRPIDVSPECAAMLEKLMLAQAQECVLEKATADGKAPATLARLAKQVAIFYDDTSRLLSSKPLSDHFDKSWQAHAAAKSLLYHLEANLQNAADLRTKDDLKGVANEIAQLRAAQEPLAVAKKEAKAASKELQDNVTDKERAVSDRLAKAERENAAVYLQRVPSAADLPGVVPFPLVKSVPPKDLGPTDDVEAMFRGVVPETTTKALSKYTDVVDALIRKQTEALDTASDDARLRLREWELPESLAALEAGSVSTLPDAVRLELEEVASAGGLPQLQDVAARIRELRSVTARELDAAAFDLDAEAREDDELRRHYGARWTPKPSAQLTSVMRDKISGYRSNLDSAAKSDATLEARLTSEMGAFGALDTHAVAAQMPRLEAPMLSVDNMEPAAAVASLRAALEGINTLSSQRAALEEALRQRKASDNILPKLLSSPSNLDALFKSELAKYDDLVKGVEENVLKQGQLLNAMASANATFRSAYGYVDWQRRCESSAQGVRSSVKTFKELQGHLADGVRFYMSLQDAVTALRQQVGDHCMTRKLQREELLEQLKKASAAHEAAAAHQFASLNVQGQGQAPYGGPSPPPPQSYGAPSGPPPQYQQQQYQQPAPHWPPSSYQQQHQQYPPAQYPSQGYGAPSYNPPPGSYPPQPPPQQTQWDTSPYGGQQGPPPPGGPPPPPPGQSQQQPPQHSNPLSGFFGFGRQ